jgi:anti-sigma regulatory factor (Ser/Thr protein kinase)
MEESTVKEISLHILDLAQNSIDAKANYIKIKIDEDIQNDRLTIIIEDNGHGMDKELLKKVEDPFITTRKTRRVGLGIPLTKAAVLRCEGEFRINSEKGKGTKVEFYFQYNHIDRAPIGDIGQTITTLLNSRDNLDIEYIHSVNGNNFVFDTKEIKKILDGVDIQRPDILLWIKDYINENIDELHIAKELCDSNI